MGTRRNRIPFLYKENHALDVWFNKAYGGEQEENQRKVKVPKEVGVGKASLV